MCIPIRQTVSYIALLSRMKENNVRVLFVQFTHPRAIAFFSLFKKRKKRVKCIYFSFCCSFWSFLAWETYETRKPVHRQWQCDNVLVLRPCPFRRSFLWPQKGKSLSAIAHWVFLLLRARACHKKLIKKNKIISLTIKINTSRTLNGVKPAARDIMIRHTLYALRSCLRTGDKIPELSLSKALYSTAASPIRRSKMCE